jgi:hypothetical protein
VEKYRFRRFDALLKLSRDTLFKEYLDYKAFDEGDSELVQLRKELLKSLDLPWIPYYVAISKDNQVITANQNGTLTLFKFKELKT